MKVKELIELLERLDHVDQDKDVVIHDLGGGSVSHIRDVGVDKYDTVNDTVIRIYIDSY